MTSGNNVLVQEGVLKLLQQRQLDASIALLRNTETADKRFICTKNE